MVAAGRICLVVMLVAFAIIDHGVETKTMKSKSKAASVHKSKPLAKAKAPTMRQENDDGVGGEYYDDYYEYYDDDDEMAGDGGNIFTRFIGRVEHFFQFFNIFSGGENKMMGQLKAEGKKVHGESKKSAMKSTVKNGKAKSNKLSGKS